MGLTLWGEIWRWRSWGGLWVVVRVQTPGTVPLFLLGAGLVGWQGVGRELTPVLSSTQEAPGVGPECAACILPGSYLACVIQGKQTWGSGLCW